MKTDKIENEEQACEEPRNTIPAIDSLAVDKIIRKGVLMSMGVGIVPLPFVNVAAVTASNLSLTRKISRMYNVDFKEGAARKIITSVLGAGVGTLATPLVGSAVAGIPLIGLPLAIGTMPALNAMTTYALSRMFVTHFENGGSFVGANIDAMKENFKSAFKNSREWLGDTIKGKAETAEA